MKTDDLIAALSADVTPPPGIGARLARALPAASLVSLVALLGFWHMRPDLVQALASPALLKTVMPLILAGIALWLAQGIARPEARNRARWAVTLVVIGGALAMLVQGLMVGGFGGLLMALDTPNLITCFVSIPILSSLPLAATFWALKAGAPANPRLAGMAAGLLAGGIGAAVYSLHCPEDSVLFFLPAYGMNILIMVALGAALGPRQLRW